MSADACTIDGCVKPRAKHSKWCPMHRSRIARHGDPHYATRRSLPAPERFWSWVEKTSGCWLWGGYRSTNGYGRVRIDAKEVTAHRYAYEQVRGPIPDGLVLDHLCRVRHCVNPSHLEAVDPAVNISRGVGATALNSRKTHCVNGHEFTPENNIPSSAAKGHRSCRICALARAAAQNEKRRAARAQSRRAA